MELGQRCYLKCGSVRTYDSGQRLYLRLCKWLRLDQDESPLSEEQLCTLSWLYCHSHKVHTLDSWLSAVEELHRQHNWPKLPRGPSFARNKRSLVNIFGQVDFRLPAVPFTMCLLGKIRALLVLDTLAQAEFWTGLLLGFWFLLRASEFCAGALKWKNVTFVKGGAQVVVAFSKTSTRPTLVTVAERADGLCPVAALRNLAHLRGTSRKGNLPVVEMSYAEFNANIKKFVRAASGGDSLGYSSHSLRRGGATLLAALGVPEYIIMEIGRWTSGAWRDYIDLSAEQQLLVTRLMRLVS